MAPTTYHSRRKRKRKRRRRKKVFWDQERKERNVGGVAQSRIKLRCKFTFLENRIYFFQTTPPSKIDQSLRCSSMQLAKFSIDNNGATSTRKRWRGLPIVSGMKFVRGTKNSRIEYSTEMVETKESITRRFEMRFNKGTSRKLNKFYKFAVLIKRTMKGTC